MDRKKLENYLGKQVEVFITPDVPKSQGVITSLDENYLTIGDEIWDYSMILGLRPLRKPKRPARHKPVYEEEDDYEEEAPEPEPQPVRRSAKPEKIKEPVKAIEPPKAEEPEEPVKAIEPPKAEEPVKLIEHSPEEKEKAQPEINLEGKIFEGTLVAFFYDEKMYGFIDSPELLATGLKLNDGKNVFVHFRQITDAHLRERLLRERKFKPMIDVTFKVAQNHLGAVADDVQEIRDEAHEVPELPEDILKVNMFSAIYEEGEIEFYRRYEEIPHGEIRVKGNKLYRFEGTDVVDPELMVFLECSPSAEGQPVRFSLGKKIRGKQHAINVAASQPFPEEKIKAWEDSGLLKKAREDLGIK